MLVKRAHHSRNIRPSKAEGPRLSVAPWLGFLTLGLVSSPNGHGRMNSGDA